MLANEFAEIFRAEHDEVHREMLNLVCGFNRRAMPVIRQGLKRLAISTGPHFRYEEETLYPVLSEYLGKAYVEEMLVEHDHTIATICRLVHLATSDQLNQAEVTTAVQQLGLLLHDVNDCNELSVVIENLPAAQIMRIGMARSRARQENLHLLEWAQSLRQRAVGCRH